MSRLRVRILLAPIVIAVMLPVVPASQAQPADGTGLEDEQNLQRRQAESFQRSLEGANAGNPNSMFIVFSHYENGSGIPKDLELAQDWLERAVAAAPGHFGAAPRLAGRLIEGSHRKQDCAEASAMLRAIVPPKPSSDAVLDRATDQNLRVTVEALRDKALKALGGDEGIAGMAPQVQADLLEVQMLDALTKQDHQAFLDNLCASEFLGYADTLPAAARSELCYHRAAALRATGKPVAALDALNTYLNTAGRDGANYQQAIMMLRPLQAEAATK